MPNNPALFISTTVLYNKTMIENSDYRGYYADCYVLSNNRTAGFIYEFLDKFLPEREESADEYLVPMYSDNPERVYNKASELIEFLCKNPTCSNTIYWANSSLPELKGAMCF